MGDVGGSSGGWLSVVGVAGGRQRIVGVKMVLFVVFNSISISRIRNFILFYLFYFYLSKSLLFFSLSCAEGERTVRLIKKVRTGC